MKFLCYLNSQYAGQSLHLIWDGKRIPQEETIVPWGRYSELLKLFKVMIFYTKMSMTCLHKAHTYREEIEISVVLLDESFLHYAFLLVGRKLCSLIFTMQQFLLGKTETKQRFE